MPKKTKQQKTKSSKPKAEQKKNGEQSRPDPAVPDPALAPPKSERLIRAIAVTKEILEAAKAYKRATGISFYQLGHDTISERLVKEGYLTLPAEPKSSSREAEVAKA